MRKIIWAVAVVVLLTGSEIDSAFAQPEGSFDAKTAVVTLNATVDQLVWMAYGAPVKTFNALGCTEEANGYAGSLSTARTIRTISLIGILGGLVLSYLDVEDVGLPIGLTLTFVSSLGSLTSSAIEVITRNNAKSHLEDLIEKHLNGEATCIEQ